MNNNTSERCSTPVYQEQQVNNILTSISDSESDRDSSSNSVIFTPTNNICYGDEELKQTRSAPFTEKKEDQTDYSQNDRCCDPKLIIESNQVFAVKPNLREKMEELEREIQTYQELNLELEKEKQTYKAHNSHLASIRAERDEKHKEEEERKLEDKRRQLKIREETFNRYQKLRRDNSTRKEREELTVLRQEVEKLQEELKRQRIKFTNENKRMKNQLIAAEQERDSLKLENITLEEQVQDLLATLKARSVKKKPEMQTKNTDKKKATISSKVSTNGDGTEALSDSSGTMKKKGAEKSDKDSNFTKPRVRFNLVPQFDISIEESIKKNLVNECTTEFVCNNTSDTDGKIYDSLTSEFVGEPKKDELNYMETKHGNEIERSYLSGEKEIIRPSGVVKHISADGKTIKYLYPNGDVKEVFPDSSFICRFITGVIEKRFPDGTEITEHPSGQIERRSSGVEEIKFPDGSTQTRYLNPNGSEKIVYDDGTQVTVDPDGTEIAEFKNGVKEIRTTQYMYPDGSVKIIYNDGSQETRLSNGRVRKKDKDGKVLLDTKILQVELNHPIRRS
ncbi:centromere protein J [Caerostris extrusa]|uniref:Centromere protein J n=1 Tax=Caerostris extrusa TaxID=172846 RepID=A0AAV4TTK0_CAEEX|nr:centromere protein J [Caerostris extrusa]